MLLDHPSKEKLQPTFAAVFAPGLTDPTRATPADVVGPRGKAAIKRYAVYRNNVTVSLIDALAATYPAVQRITGVEFFRAMARFHIRATPPTWPRLSRFHCPIRACAGNAVACGCGADRAGLARRLSCRRRRAAASRDAWRG